MQKRIVFQNVEIVCCFKLAGIEKGFIYYSLFEIDETPGNILIG